MVWKWENDAHAPAAIRNKEARRIKAQQKREERKHLRERLRFTSEEDTDENSATSNSSTVSDDTYHGPEKDKGLGTGERPSVLGITKPGSHEVETFLKKLEKKVPPISKDS